MSELVLKSLIPAVFAFAIFISCDSNNPTGNESGGGVQDKIVLNVNGVESVEPIVVSLEKTSPIDITQPDYKYLSVIGC